MQQLNRILFAAVVAAAAPAAAETWSARVTPVGNEIAGADPAAVVDTSAVIQGLKGRWAGAGKARLEDGRHVAFDCIATYFMNKQSTRLRQNLRCKSEEMQIQLVSNLAVDGHALSGTWEETKYKLKGTLIGNVDQHGLALYAENEFANAAISVAVGTCDQAVTMRFSRQVSELTASLKKC